MPVVLPGHGEQIEAAVFKDLHLVLLDGYLGIGTAGPGPQQLLCITVAHDHYVQGLGGPEIADGHSVQRDALGH